MENDLHVSPVVHNWTLARMVADVLKTKNFVSSRFVFVAIFFNDRYSFGL